MILIATDLDRTLFPNGKQEYDNSMPEFKKMVEENDITLIYVTGRNIDQIEEGITAYDPPLPAAAVAEVGTKVYTVIDGAFVLDEGYRDHIDRSTSGWDRQAIVKALDAIPGLRMQEEHNQNEFKISYYADEPPRMKEIERQLEEIVGESTPDAALTTSVDETVGVGLLDIMPRKANKMEGIEYLVRKMGVEKDRIIYCGDSGNDLVPLTAGYKAVVVANATDEVRRRVADTAEKNNVADKIYYARGNTRHNGNYVSGILEGLEHFKVLSMATE